MKTDKQIRPDKGRNLFFRKRWVISIFFSSLFLICGCSADKVKKNLHPEVILFSEQSGMNVVLHFLFDVEGNSQLYEKDETVILKTPSESIHAVTGFNSSGDFYFLISEGNMINYGTYSYILIDGESVPMFKSKGSREKRFGARRNGDIYFVSTDNKITQVGESRYFLVTPPDDQKQSVFASRLFGSIAGWTVALDEKIFKISDDGKLTQVGWVEWRIFSTTDGKTMATLMTKGMDKKSRWAGHFDGKFYQDP